jgi:plasmid stability protein
MAKQYPSQKQDQFIVRLPDGMRERIRVAAEANSRSMNAEIVATLEEKYPAPSTDASFEALASFLEQMGLRSGIAVPAKDAALYRRAIRALAFPIGIPIDLSEAELAREMRERFNLLLPFGPEYKGGPGCGGGGSSSG